MYSFLSNTALSHTTVIYKWLLFLKLPCLVIHQNNFWYAAWTAHVPKKQGEFIQSQVGQSNWSYNMIQRSLIHRDDWVNQWAEEKPQILPSGGDQSLHKNLGFIFHWCQCVVHSHYSSKWHSFTFARIIKNLNLLLFFRLQLKSANLHEMICKISADLCLFWTRCEHWRNSPDRSTP